jgi:hypothetical protein
MDGTTLDQLELEEVVEIRNRQVDVAVVKQTQQWQRVGCVETLQGKMVTIRWHNGDKAVGFGNRPVSQHPISDVVVL